MDHPHHFMIHEHAGANATKNVELTQPPKPESKLIFHDAGVARASSTSGGGGGLANLPNLSPSWISGSNFSREHGHGSVHSFCCGVFAGNLPRSIPACWKLQCIHSHSRPCPTRRWSPTPVRMCETFERMELPQFFCCSLSSAKQIQANWRIGPSKCVRFWNRLSTKNTFSILLTVCLNEEIWARKSNFRHQALQQSRASFSRTNCCEWAPFQSTIMLERKPCKAQHNQAIRPADCNWAQQCFLQQQPLVRGSFVPTQRHCGLWTQSCR